MLMEALDGHEQRIEYAIVAHSGEETALPLVEYGKPPRSRKQRLEVVMRVIAHAQFCYSGDSTFEAATAAVEEVASHQQDDEGIVVVISDANLRRYGLAPRELGARLLASDRVHAVALFIASFGEEAERIRKELPPGRGLVALDTARLPAMLREIFVARLLF